ncbi:MAG: polysialyltransferase family glycosyltransferase [Bacteroidota bacterium]
MNHSIIFFILGFNQKLIFDFLSKEFNPNKVVVFTSLPNLDFPKGVKVISIKDIALKPIKIIKLRNELNKIVRNINCVQVVYLPHVMNFLSNYFAFTKRIECKKILTYDGILNLTSTNKGIEKRWLKHQFFQFIKSCIVGIKYKFVFSKVTGEDVINFDQLIIPAGIKIINSHVKNVRELDFKWKTIKSQDENICLLLEQPFLNSNLDDYFNELTSLIKKERLSRIVIKLHPQLQKSKIYEVLKERLSPDSMLIEIYSGNKSAEDLILDLGIGLLISTNSTALINCRIFYPNLKVVSLGLQYSSNDVKNLTAIFDTYGVIVC